MKDLRLPLDGKLVVQFPRFQDALAEFPNDPRVALRGFAISEASRFANAIFCSPEPASNVVMLFSRSDIGLLRLRQKRFDFVITLLKTNWFERRVAAKLVKQGRIEAELLA
jgi:hypothetical protein